MKPDPYLLPEGNVQICFSGGRTSAYMLSKIIERNGPLPDRVKVIFTNTGREFGETLDFVKVCQDRLGVQIIWLEYTRVWKDSKRLMELGRTLGIEWVNPFQSLWKTVPYFEKTGHNSASRNGEPFMKMIEAKKYLPNVVSRFCTIELKIRTAKRYLISQGWTKWTNLLGIRADEPSRIKRDQPKERWSNEYPLFDAGVSVRDIADYWKASEFDLGLMGFNGKTPLGNCDGCFLKSEANRAALARDFPERFAWWIEAEERASSIAKQSAANFRKDSSYQELSEFVKDQGRLFDETGGWCQASAGDCTG